MRKVVFSIASLALGAGMGFGQTPTISSVANAASYSTDIARGSIFVMFGTNMGPASIVVAGAAPLKPELSGTTVKFTPAGGGATLDALMFYTLAGQVAALLPSTAAAWDYNVTVSYHGQTSAPFAAKVVDRNFGIISRSGTGQGPGVVQNQIDNLVILNGYVTTNVSGLEVAPASEGQALIIWGTGLGPITGSDADAPGLLT